MLEQNSAGATNSSTSASRRSSRLGHLSRVLLSTVMPAAAEPPFLRQRSVEVGAQAGPAARRLVEGRLKAALQVAEQQGGTVERRVGKRVVCTCSCRWAPYH